MKHPPPEYFKYPKSLSPNWNFFELKSVYKWLIKENNKCGLGARQKIIDRAIDSRDTGSINKRGNIEGLRFLLSQLYQHGYVEFRENDNEHYYIIQKADEINIDNLLNALNQITNQKL